jgi:hypothetical protein
MRLARYHKERVDQGDCGKKKFRRTAGARYDGPYQCERLLALARPSAGRDRGTHEETPRHSVVPRRVKTIAEVILLWRHGDPGKGSEYPLRRIQTAADRKIVIKTIQTLGGKYLARRMACPGIGF